MTTARRGRTTLPAIVLPSVAMPALHPAACTYVVRLARPEPGQPRRLAGRVEHVASGRRHDFDDGAALLALLAREQACLDVDDAATDLDASR